MYGRTDRKKYSLFFASNSPKGFEKMKEAMWSVDKDAGSMFSDAAAPSLQKLLFDTMTIEPLWDEMLAQFGGKTVPMTEVEKFVREATRFLPKHARQLLKAHEDEDDISVIAAVGYKRKRGTFKADKVQIRFPVDAQ